MRRLHRLRPLHNLSGWHGGSVRHVLSRVPSNTATMTTAESILRSAKRLAGSSGTRKASALTRPPSHGGFRAGSGRKPILDGGIKRTFVLTPAHLDLIDAWGRTHNIDNRSAALRHLIEHASPMVPHPHQIP
jgi:hypothetical protein